MVIRIAANLAELKKNLAEGKAQIETTTAAMSKLASSFQGDKLVQHAHNVVAALHQVGGAATLSSAEAARQLATLDKAMEKLTLTGKPIPAAMASTADALRRVADSGSYADKAMGFLKSTFGQMVGAFTAVNLLNRGVSTLTAWGKEAFSAAGATIDLANQTGLSTDTIQRFQHVAKQTGSTLEGFTNASFQLGMKLHGGSDSVRQAVAALGLSFEEMRRSSPDEQFARIAAAAGNLATEQGRNKVAADLFGKAAKDVMPAIVEGYKKIADAAAVTGKAQLEALDEAADAWDAFVERQKKGLQGWLGNVVIAKDTLGKLNQKQMVDYLEFLRAGGDGEKFLLDLAKKKADVHLAAEKTSQSVFAEAEAFKQLKEDAGKLVDRVNATTEAHFKLGLALRRITLDVVEAVKAQREQADVFPPLIERYTYLTGAMTDTRTGTERMTDALKAAAVVQGGEFKKAAEETHRTIKKAEAQTLSWRDNLSSLAQSMTQLAQTAKSDLIGALASMTNAFDVGGKAINSLKGGFKDFTSGKGLSSILSGMSGMVGGVAGIVSAMQTAIQIGKALWSTLKQVFGGPSKEEQKGRELVAEFEEALAATLTAAQRLEAGNESWKKTTIAVRDAYLAAGLSAEEAHAAVERLWASSRSGAEASRRAIEEIQRVLNGLPTDRTVNVNITRTENRGEIEEENSFAGGTGGFRWFGNGTPAMLHGWEAVVRPGDPMPGDAGGTHETVINLDGDVLVRHIERRLSRKLRGRQLLGAV